MFKKEEIDKKDNAAVLKQLQAEGAKQRQLLINLRVESEMKLEKSAVVTLSHVTDVVRMQAVVNKNLVEKKKNFLADVGIVLSKLSHLQNERFESVEAMKFSLRSVVKELRETLEEY